MNCIPQPIRALTLLITICLFACLSGCGGSSTDTGNPPGIELQGVSIVPTGDGVLVSGGPGSVSPGSAEVEVTNVSTGRTASTVAESDGSFEVSIEGTPSDDYQITVTADGRTTSANLGAGSAGNDSLRDREFLLVESMGFSPVEDTTVRLFFDEASGFGFSAGCNSHFGDYTLCDGKLCSDGLGSTAIGCNSELHMQDEWLAEFFTSEPTLLLDGDTLTVSNGDATLEFLDREAADPDRSLTGRVWSIDTFISGGAASNSPLNEVPTVEFDADGSFGFNTTCNQGGGSYTVSGTTLNLTEVAVTEAGCPDSGSASAEMAILAVLGEGNVTFEIEAARLTLMRGTDGLSATTP
jgi:heat shock protein HslJ